MSTKKITLDQNVFGTALKWMRKHRGLSLEELGKELNISYSYIGRIERGDREPEALIRKVLDDWILDRGKKYNDDGSINTSVKEQQQYCFDDLKRLIALWPHLCPDQRAAIMSVADAFSKPEGDSLEKAA